MNPELEKALKDFLPVASDFILNEKGSCGHAITPQSQRKLDRLDGIKVLLNRVDTAMRKGEIAGKTQQIEYIERPKPVKELNVKSETTTEHCATCDNKGKIKGLSQETFCEQCVFQQTWREDHYKPKPAKQQIDWSKLSEALRLLSHCRGIPVMPTRWIAWNCDEHTRGNPLPEGLMVTWLGRSNAHGAPDHSAEVPWADATRFRIVGIQEGWDA